ncbi:polysaccharide biosynthesis protein [Paenibacillus sp. GD4]|uniref:putative polysaccharide biosynthesis protein n=1 Tax=Paenibacillus sp. GD4 TaxID=3068890 RepID=UPI0027965876|nr:polysaccharide biosynthesis protein [Paenibacillus sp. GD4]MDQ1912099.1 polysaccharide biosynthesis protein [Paenibacillus sp. GD4]
MSKDSLVKGTLILTLAALVARALGVVQRIPLVYLLGEIGMASYAIAFNLYSMLLVVATAGIPSALSKMISERTALGRTEEADRIYKAALWFAAGAGVVMTVILYGAAPYYADMILNPQAVLPIRAIAPALLLFPLIAIMRGYFQGRQMMMPNGISQIIEQIFRVVTSVGLALLLLGVGLDFAVAGASFGGVIGSIAAFAVMLYYGMRLRKKDRSETEVRSQTTVGADAQLPYKTIYAQLFKLSVPIVIFSMTVTLIYTIDSSIVTLLLKDSAGEDGAREILGILGGRAQSLAGIPIILAVALSQSVVPIISSAYSQKDLKGVADQAGKVLRLSILTGLPAVLVICLAARPINGFIFGNPTGSVWVEQYAAPIIIALTASAMFQIIMQTSGAVLMGLGRMRSLVLGVVAGIGAKLAFSYVLAPWFGIYGIIGATMLCFVVMTVLNLLVLRQEIKFRVLGKRRWATLTMATAAVILLGIGLDLFARAYVHPLGSPRWDDMLQAILIVGITSAAYPVLLLLTKTVTADDIQQMPGPIRRLARPILNRLGGTKLKQEG